MVRQAKLDTTSEMKENEAVGDPIKARVFKGFALSGGVAPRFLHY